MSIINIGINAAGFYRDRLDVILENLQAKTKLIYGNDINLDAPTPDGQFLGAMAECIDDHGQAIEDTYNGRNPDVATGQNLTSTARLNGVNRGVGDYASVDVSMIINSGAVIPAGAQVADEDTGVVYASVVGVTGTGGAQLVTCKALVKGQISAAGKVTQIVKPIYGLLSVTNPSASTVVDAYETDEQLRIRRNLSTATPTVGYLDSIRAGLLAVPGIGQLKLWENDTGVVQSIKTGDNALPPHTIAAVLTGGSASDIGAALYTRKPPGITTVGSSTVTVSDSLSIPHVFHYTTAAPVEYHLEISYRERAGAGFGGGGGEEAVKAALVAWSAANQPPSGDVYRFHLAAIAQQAVIGLDGLPAMAIEDIQVGRTAPELTDSDLVLAWTEIGSLLTGNIIMVALT
jgi:uncharacterized phage protein gp47/JayE